MTTNIILKHPFKKEVRISNPFSIVNGHEGIDYASLESWNYRNFYGTPVYSAHAGKVILGYSISGYGLYVYLVSSDETFATVYAHLGETFVKSGQLVKEEELLGLVGCTGNCRPPGTKGTHLHFGLRKLPSPVPRKWPYGYEDPAPYMEEL